MIMDKKFYKIYLTSEIDIRAKKYLPFVSANNINIINFLLYKNI